MTGIIVGLAWPATLEYCRAICLMSRENRGEQGKTLSCYQITITDQKYNKKRSTRSQIGLENSGAKAGTEKESVISSLTQNKWEATMRIITVLLIVVGLLVSTSAMAVDFDQMNAAVSANGPHGPAPNSGDGVPDGSGQDSPYGPNNGK